MILSVAFSYNKYVTFNVNDFLCFTEIPGRGSYGSLSSVPLSHDILIWISISALVLAIFLVVCFLLMIVAFCRVSNR